MKRLPNPTIEKNGWVSFRPMNGAGRLLKLEELKAMPLVRLIALIRRISDWIRVANDNDCNQKGQYDAKTVFQICWINYREGWGYSDLVHLKRACKGKGNHPSKSVRKLRRQCRAKFKDRDVKWVGTDNVLVNLENGSVFVNGFCQNPWPGLCDRHVKSLTK